jgi:hypothetical protein
MIFESCWCLLEIQVWTECVTWVNWSFDHLQSGNLVNIENQYCRWLTQVSSTYLHALLRQAEPNLLQYENRKETRISVESWKPIWCRSKVRTSSRTEIQEQFGRKWSISHDHFRLGLIFRRQIFFVSVLPVLIESVRSEQSSQNWLLTSNYIDLRETFYTTFVDNFNTFPANVNMPSSDNWYRSNDLRMSGGVAEISRFFDILLYIFGVGSSSRQKPRKLQIPQMLGTSQSC